MPSPLREKNEIKIFILFLLDKIGYPLDYNTIGSIVVQDGIVRFFDFADAFYQLLDAGHICRAEAAEKLEKAMDECPVIVTSDGKIDGDWEVTFSLEE